MGSTCARSNTRQIYSVFVSASRGIEFHIGRGGKSFTMIGNQLNIHALFDKLDFLSFFFFGLFRPEEDDDDDLDEQHPSENVSSAAR